MFFVRLLALLFLVAFGIGMGTQPSRQLNAFGHFMTITLLATVPTLYMLPTMEAWFRKQPNIGAIAVLNVLAGWTLLGWVVAAVWAFKKPEPTPVFHATPPPAAPRSSAADEIAKLGDLRNRGLLTESEFQDQKRTVLSSRSTNAS